MSAASTDLVRRDQAVVGDARLHQVRTFIEQVEPNQTDLMRLLLGGLRGRLFPAIGFGLILGLIGAIATYFLVSPSYQSQSLIRIIARETKILYSDADEARLRLFDAFVAAEVNYLTSRPVLDLAIERLQDFGVEKMPSDVGELSQLLQITSTKGLVTIAGRSGDARSAAAIVNSVVDSYTELRLKQSEGQLTFRTKELTTREASLVQQLEALDKRILLVSGEYGVDSINKAHVNKIGQIDELSSRIDELTTTINQLETVGHAVNTDTGDAEIRRSMLLDNSMASMTYDRAKKAAELAALEKRYKSDNPKLAAVRAEVRVLDGAIDQRRAQIASLGQFGGLTQNNATQEQSVGELRALLEKLQNRRSEIEAAARDLNGRIVELNYLKEERLQMRTLLDETRRVLEEIRVESRNAMPGEAEVVSRGSVPDRPIEDKRRPMALVGFFAGLGLTVSAFALWGLLRPSIRHETDVAGLGRIVAMAGSLQDTPASAHRLRNAVQLAAARISGDRGRSIAVVGAGTGQGATTLAHALADSFQKSGSKVAVIDAHLSWPQLSERLGATGSAGLKEWITAGEEGVAPLRHESGISVVPAGCNQEAFDYTLSLPLVRRVVQTLSKAHDVVLADSGVVNRDLASSLFSAESDIVLLALRRGIQRNRAQSAAVALAAACRKQILVVLVGEQPPEVPKWFSDFLSSAKSAGTKKISKILRRIKRG